MADVFTLHGEEFTPPEPAGEGNLFVAYLRDLATLIENGTVAPEALVTVIRLPGCAISTQRVGTDQIGCIGLLAIGQRIHMGV